MGEWLADIEMGVAGAEALRQRLLQAIDDGVEVIRLTPEAQLDTAGAQLLVAAVHKAREKGRRLGIAIPAGSPAIETWRNLALDAGALADPAVVSCDSGELA